MTTPERSVEEKFRKLQKDDPFYFGHLTENQIAMICSWWGHYLQAERQKREEVVREAKKSVYDYIEDYVMTAELLDGSQTIATSDILNKLKALTQPNNN